MWADLLTALPPLLSSLHFPLTFFWERHLCSGVFVCVCAASRFARTIQTVNGNEKAHHRRRKVGEEQLRTVFITRTALACACLRVQQPKPTAATEDNEEKEAGLLERAITTKKKETAVIHSLTRFFLHLASPYFSSPPPTDNAHRHNSRTILRVLKEDNLFLFSA